MKRFCLSVIVLFITTTIVIAQTAPVTVFESGKEGHKSYRIPAIVALKNGTLLAFAEGRVNNAGDFGDINIVLKRSTDGGKTWTSLQTIVDYDQLQAGNPAPVVDLTDPMYPQGRVFLFYNTGNNHEGEVRKGKGLREVWYKTSTDGGITWSEAVNITTQTHRPKQPATNAAYNFSEDWRSYANTPGHAMQFSTGVYKGRIFVAANHSAGEPLQHFEDYKAHGFYTDDHGKTFQLSETVDRVGGNEAMATQISGDRLMMNIRNQKGDVRARLIAISKDGGAKWDSVYFDNNLPDPVCQGSIVTLGKKKGKHIVAFCNAADTKSRDNLTLRISYDDGFTWTKNMLIDATGKRDNAAYSDIVPLPKKQIGILYEKDNYASIIFTVVKWN
ncbi:MAG: glycoside hydrolase [Bacteroidetes bacterium]|uniref:sialidase family protein n=1 Tax=Phnomibacter sp. TaxID=2836217 RepID=UPI002FDEC8E6|nr:glycoside hydrolase [Bacteroidota bacterium]